MAYVSHGSFDYHSLRGRLAHVPASLLIRSAVVAVAAVVAVLALSEANQSAAPVGAAALMKADRLAAATTAAPVDGARVLVDTAAHTTTIERGANTALAPDSPMLAKGR